MLMNAELRLNERACKNCNAICNATQLYCPRCGYILPEALASHSAFATTGAVHIEDDGTTTPLEQQFDTGSMRALPGTALFHQQARLFLHHDSGRIVTVDIQTGPKVLGRRSQQFVETGIIDLSDLGGKEFGVSRQHLRLLLRDEIVYGIDLGTTNGTFLNRERMIPEKPYMIRNRAVLQLGVLILRVQFA